MARLPAGLAEIRSLTASGLDLIVQMPLLSEAIHRAFPSFSLSMIRVDEGFAPREHYSEHFDEWSHRLFAESGHLFAAAGNDPAAFGRLLRNRRPVGSLLRTSPEYLAGGTYQHLFQRNGIHHCLDVAVRSANGPLGILGVFREQDAPPFTTEDVARMSLVYDDIVHAFEARQLVGPFDEIESAVLVVDGRGAIEWASPTARMGLVEAAIAEERTLVADRAQLPAAAAELARLLRSGPSAEATPTLLLPFAGGGFVCVRTGSLQRPTPSANRPRWPSNFRSRPRDCSASNERSPACKSRRVCARSPCGFTEERTQKLGWG